MSKKKLRILKYLFLILAYIGLFTPLAIIIIANRNQFFVRNQQSLTVTMGGLLAIFYCFILFKVGFKKIHPTVSCAVLVLVCYCLQSILKYSFILSLGLLIGVGIYSILMIPEKYFAKILDTYVDEEVRVNVRKKQYADNTELESGRC